MLQIGTTGKTSLFSKVFVIGLLIVVAWVPTMFVLGLVNERSNRANDAVAEIATQWSREQTLSGPVLTIPVNVPVTNAAGERTVKEEAIFLLPDTLNYDVSLDTQVLSRGIFDARVYNSVVQGSGTFSLDQIDLSGITGTIEWDKASLSIGIPDTRGLDSGAVVTWNNSDTRFEPGVPTDLLGETGISAPVAVNRFASEHTFSFEIHLRGSEGINFAPLGKTTTVSVSSNWNSPNFTGEFLPKEREVTEDGFTANWAVSSFGRSLPQSWTGPLAFTDQTVQANIKNATFGVELHEHVDFYTQADRSVKYSILFIALTFLAFFMFEVLSKLRIHPMNYLLVGLAIAIFYLLLLSFSENIGFLWAYVLSTAAVTTLITLYCRSVLQAKKRAGIIMVLLLALYTYLYVLLQLDELSLIFGSIFLFAILSTVMYLTRNINWYELSDK